MPLRRFPPLLLPADSWLPGQMPGPAREPPRRADLGALNAAVRVLLDELNDRPMKKLGVSRRALYEQLDRPALRPLPAAR